MVSPCPASNASRLYTWMRGYFCKWREKYVRPSSQGFIILQTQRESTFVASLTISLTVSQGLGILNVFSGYLGEALTNHVASKHMSICLSVDVTSERKGVSASGLTTDARDSAGGYLLNYGSSEQDWHRYGSTSVRRSNRSDKISFGNILPK
jgi:hypothetical protein